ncbi:hypothetical protein [Candidatus Symbiopectobacterium sp.]|nr:hypothetical protein [Candidatus Symbiopectobacterium sp.]
MVICSDDYPKVLFIQQSPGYSKSSKMHDRIIGTYIEREYYV